MSSWPPGDNTGRTGAEFEALIAPGTRVDEYGAVGDGVTDDTAAIRRALIDSYVTGVLSFEPKTYVVNEGTAGVPALTVSSKVRIEGNGAVLKKANSLNNYIMKITGADVLVNDIEFNGARTDGNSNSFGCLWFNGLRGTGRGLYAHNSKIVGIFVSGSGVEVDCYSCEASNILTTATTGDGFQVGAGAVLRTDSACEGYFNGHCTFHASATAADACHLDGKAGNNGFSAISILSDNGTSNSVRVFNNQTYGLYGQQASGWTFEHVESDDEGQALNGVTWAQNPSATSIECLGCDSWDLSNVVSRRPLGYGIAYGQIAGTGCTYMTVGRYNIDFPGDPGIFIGGNSQYNSYGFGRVRGDIAVSFGESTAGNNNDWNEFGFLHAIDCGFSVIRGTQAHHNTFGHVHATNCWNRAPYVGFVQWISGTPVGADCSYNRILNWTSENPGSPPSGAALPNYVLNCDLTSTHNWILAGFAEDVAIAVLHEGGSGTNRIDFVVAP